MRLQVKIYSACVLIILLLAVGAVHSAWAAVTVEIASATPQLTVKNNAEIAKIAACRHAVMSPDGKRVSYDPVVDTLVKSSEGKLYGCSHAAAKSLPRRAEDALNSFQETLIWIINTIIILIGNIGNFFLSLGVKAMEIFLGFNQFITHPFVRTGWPFLLGISNLGFIIALLFIAGATTLHLDNYGVKKMLPRLLIAVLLVNFSLIIGAIIIDASRVLMAIEVRMMSNGKDISQLGKEIVRNSPLVKNVTEASTGSFVSAGTHSINIPVRLFQGALVVWALAIGMLYISVALLVRWVALVILLIFSPLAYLALALPNTGGLAKRWWNEFLKWAFYGPILLFFILIIASVGEDDLIPIPTENELSPWIRFADTLIIAGLLFAATKAGKALAGAGGAGVLNAATGFGQARLRNARSGLALTGRAALSTGRGVATAGQIVGTKYPKLGLAGNIATLGIPKAFQGVKSVRDFVKTSSQNYAKNRKKEEEERKQKSRGTQFASYLNRKPTDQKAMNDAKTASALQTVLMGKINGTPGIRQTAKDAQIADKINDNANGLSVSNLLQPAFATSLSTDVIQQIMVNTNVKAAKKQALTASLAGSKDLGKDTAQAAMKAALQVAMPDPTTGAVNDTSLVETLVNSMNVVKNLSDEQFSQIVQLNDKQLTAKLFKMKAVQKQQEDKESGKKDEGKKPSKP